MYWCFMTSSEHWVGQGVGGGGGGGGGGEEGAARKPAKESSRTSSSHNFTCHLVGPTK